MKFKCKVSEIIPALEGVNRATSKKSEVVLLTNVLLEVIEKKGRKALMLTGNSLSFGQKDVVGINSDAEIGKICLDGKFMLDILKRLSAEELTFIADGTDITIASGKTKFNIKGLNPDAFPQVNMCDPKSQNTFSIKGSTIKTGLSNVYYAVAIDETRPILNGVNFNITGGKLELSAVDGYRVANRVLDITAKSDLELNFTVPASILRDLGQSIDDETEAKIIVDEKYMFVIVGGGRYMALKLLEGDYLKVADYKNSQTTKSFKCARQELIRAIERANLVANMGNKTPLSLTMAKDKLTINAKTENNAFKDEVNGEYETDEDKKSLTIHFNGKYLIDCLKNISDDEIILKFNNPMAPLIISSDAYFSMTLPIRVNN